jgi:uncharacterized protein
MREIQESHFTMEIEITDGSSNCCTRKHWNAYAVGAGIGILSWLLFVIVDKPLGMSTEVSKWSGWVVSLVSGKESMLNNSYWASKTPAFGYSTIFLLFTLLGATVSAVTSGSFKWEKVPTVWQDHFGGSPAKRYLAAFVGGAVLLFGARLAGGCTSGHGISGTLQLAASGWLFFAALFLAGAGTAKLLFRSN